MNALYFQQKSLKESLDRAEKRAASSEDFDHPFWKRVFQLEEENDKVRKQIANLVEEAYED